ncbi:MAG: PspA/IM30 family protein [Candidatus Riflebacteria bacterium]|nr:PspA/IM30 family protein [Candidatus Riflebacteria bacterium]
MGIFKKISLIIRSNLSALLDKAEDPEKMLEQITADMIENMREIKLQLARSMKDEKMLEKKVEENEKLVEEYQKRALNSVESNDDNLAREALKRKKSYSSIVESLKKELEEQKKSVEFLRTSYKALEVKIDEAKSKKQVLLSRQKRAETKLEMTDNISTINNQAELFETFERMAEKIDHKEALASAVQEIEKVSIEEKFAKLELSKTVDEELKLLKKELNK